MHNKFFLSIILSLLLAGCSSDKNTASTPEKKTESIFQGQINSLNKAKKVEDTILKADQDRRKTIDDASTGH